MENRSHAFAAGMFVVLLGLAALGGAFWLSHSKGPRLQPLDLLTGYSVAGLQVDAPVRFRGVYVGRVEAIAFDPHRRGQIRVRIGVDPAAPLTRSTFAKLSYQGITGVTSIDLDDALDTQSAPLWPAATGVPQMDLQASFIQRAEDSAHELIVKATDVASRLDELLSEPNRKRFTALLESSRRTSDGIGTLARDLQLTAKSLPPLVGTARGAVDRVTQLAEDADGKLGALDAVASAAGEFGRATQDVDRDTLPRLNAFLEEASIGSRELERTIRDLDSQPQSLIFGRRSTPPGPGEPGFHDAGNNSR